MKYFLATVATALALLVSSQVTSAETFDNRVDHEVGQALVFALDTCMVTGGYNQSLGPSSRVAASGRTVLDYDQVVSQKIDSINKCWTPFFVGLADACDCDDFAGAAALYANELNRLNGWLAVGVVNVVLGPAGQETVVVGSSRYSFLTGE